MINPIFYVLKKMVWSNYPIIIFRLFLLFLIPWWAFIPIQVIISFNFFAQSIFCWLLTCVYHIYWIRVNWYWHLSLGVIANFQSAVSKQEIRICFPHRILEGHGERSGFCDFTCCNQYIDWLQGSSSSYSSLRFCRKVLAK